MHKKILIILLSIYVLLMFISSSPLADIEDKPYTILIINSYDNQNKWENLVFQGLKNSLRNYHNLELKVEFLDSKSSTSDNYFEIFSELINLKYKDIHIDSVLTVDDEALFLVKSNISNENSIFYHKPTVFLGVNNKFELNEIEEKYMTGIVEMEDNLRLLNLLVSIQPNLDEIFLLFDDSIFSKVVQDDINSINLFVNNSPKLNYIQGDYIENILSKLPLDSNAQKQAILIVGDFKSTQSNNFLPLEDTISILESNINIPIYAKTQPYILAGAIGGIVDIAQHHGYMAASIFIRLINNVDISDISFIYNSFNLTLFNYKSLAKYQINPLLLPKESIIINKGIFDFLLPLPLKIIVWSLIIFALFFVVFLILLYFRKRRQQLIAETLYAKALENEKFKNDFITTMSHEFRTPINIILSTCHLLNLVINENKLEPDYIKQRLTYISQNSNRLLKLVNNVIDITKIESNVIDLNLSLQNIVEVVENTVLSVIDLVETNNLNLTFDTEEEEIYTNIDKSKIERCILNLLSNCIKFTPEQGAIKVYITKTDDKIKIDVSDNGIGIPEDQLPYIFDRFHQVNTELIRNSEGSGLGLFIVKGLLELHNGSISVKSTLGRGSTFSIILPINNTQENNINNVNNNTLHDLIKVEFSDINK